MNPTDNDDGPKFAIQIGGERKFTADNALDAMALSAAFCPLNQAAYVYRSGSVVAEIWRIGSRHSWTLTADPELWDAFGMLPAGHSYTDESVKP